MLRAIRATRSLTVTSTLPRRMSSQPRGTATTQAWEISEASKHCSTTRSHCSPVPQYSPLSAEHSSPAVEHSVIATPGKRRVTVRAT